LKKAMAEAGVFFDAKDVVSHPPNTVCSILRLQIRSKRLLRPLTAVYSVPMDALPF